MQQDRRKFITSLTMLGAAGLGPAPSFASKRTTEGQTILKAGPYLQFPGPESITVRWLTQTPCISWVMYGETGDKLDKKAEAYTEGLVQAYNTVHAITLSGLEPGKKYFYRICSRNIDDFQPYKVTYGNMFEGETHTFSTSDVEAGQVSFLVFNDIHDRPESFPLLMQYKGEEERDFVFLNGDMFNFQTDEDQLVEHLLRPLGGMPARTPFFFSRGNHEVRGKFARHLPDYFNSGDPRFFFSFQWGPMYAIVLDSGEDKPDDSPEYYGLVDFDRYRRMQAGWLKEEVKKKAFRKAKYKVVFSHIPLYNAGEWHGTVHCREVWGDILNDAGIDLMISGHTHVYGIHPAEKGKHNYPIVIGGGPKDGKRTIIRVKADGEALKLEMLDDAGKMVGELKV
ncbi:MAG TPA: FN3 domain-containing metallophosphoesterase family protein [Puia sp.]|nr:FN3 domain-containing metallophosphoesterase family protein [Puia sp.]